MLKMKSSLIFLGVVIFAVLMVLLAVLYILQVIFKAELITNFLQYCIDIVKSGTEGKSLLAFLLFGMIIYGLGSVLYQIGKQFKLIMEMNQRLKRIEIKPLSQYYQMTFGSSKQGMIVIDQNDPMAFTMGFLRPKIILSTGLLEVLDQEELKAVIHHETFHQKNRDPLKVFIMTVICNTFRFVPVMKDLLSYYKIHRELLADQYAMAKVSSINLGSALLKLARRNIPKIEPIAAVSVSDTALNYRIKQIVEGNPNIYVTFPFKGRRITLTLGMVFVFISMTLSGCA